MYQSIHIPKPCAEDWEAMTPQAQGRHCAQCCKTVIDFTGWEVDTIAAYLTKNAESRVCGRFTSDQLQQDYFIPETYLYNVFASGLHYLKQIAAIILFVFVLSDAAHAQAKHHIKKPQPQMQQPLKGDVEFVEPEHLAGTPLVLPPVADTLKKPVMQGEVAPRKPRVIMGKPRKK